MNCINKQPHYENYITQYYNFNSLSLICTISVAQNQQASIQVNVTNFKNVNLKGEQILFINQTTKKTTKGISNSKGNFTVKLSPGYI